MKSNWLFKTKSSFNSLEATIKCSITWHLVLLLRKAKFFGSR
nr:hypothetical protein [Lacticaseibacillus thailandensis]